MTLPEVAQDPEAGELDGEEARVAAVHKWWKGLWCSKEEPERPTRPGASKGAVAGRPLGNGQTPGEEDARQDRTIQRGMSRCLGGSDRVDVNPSCVHR